MRRPLQSTYFERASLYRPTATEFLIAVVGQLTLSKFCPECPLRWRWRGQIVGGCESLGESRNGPERAIAGEHQFSSTLLLNLINICQVSIATVAQTNGLD